MSEIVFWFGLVAFAIVLFVLAMTRRPVSAFLLLVVAMMGVIAGSEHARREPLPLERGGR